MKPLINMQGKADVTGDELRLAKAADRARRAQEDVAVTAVRALQVGAPVLTIQGAGVVLYGSALADFYGAVKEWQAASEKLEAAQACCVIANVQHVGRA
jgi:hypothetical protein